MNDYLPKHLLGLHLESSLKCLNSRLSELGILAKDGFFDSLCAAEKIAPRIAMIYKTRNQIFETLRGLNDKIEVL